MKLIETGIPGLTIIQPPVYADARGVFLELWKSSSYRACGLPGHFVQTNISRSGAGVLRGMHYQYPCPQGKLISVLAGSVYDVALDIRSDSPAFRQWVGVELSAANHRQLYIPEGMAHGFCVLGDGALMCYGCTAEYQAEFDAAIAWNDPDVGVEWPLMPTALSAKDSSAPRLRDIALEDLPRMVV